MKVYSKKLPANTVERWETLKLMTMTWRGVGQPPKPIKFGQKKLKYITCHTVPAPKGIYAAL